ncbi:MAG: S-layer homology domain-containing protein [Oscillospiraceae bacterium]|nr:S-layer homology domain-containing protein [Oscillospiraceae bacterium]
MKNIRRFLAILLCAASLMSVCAYADANAGKSLNIFEDVAEMTSFTFKDVNSNTWSFNGIKTAYDKGILVGYQDGTFRPKDYVTWGQAIVIAARIHAAYNNNALRLELREGDYWYSPCQRYCEGHGMIPADCPKGVNLDRVVIPRYALAYIFSRTVDLEDLPTISNRQITDLNKIPAGYVDSVKLMYASGVLTGWADYSFGGDRLTNREQISVVISRLLQPSERIGYDSKANADMAPYEANLENESAIVQIGSTYYTIYKYFESTTVERTALYATTGKDDAVEIYTCETNQRIENLSVYEGKVYFCVSTAGTCSGKLMCFDPATAEFDVVYYGNAVKSYCFYDGEVYALLFTEYGKVTFGADGSMDLSGWKYQFGRLESGSFVPLMDEMDYYQTMYFVPYGWNGSIYFKLCHTEVLGSGEEAAETYVANLYSYRISDGYVEKLSNLRINTSLFDGHVMYFMTYDEEGAYDMNLYALSLQSPAAVKRIGEFPSPMDKQYRSLYKHEDTVYLLSTFNRNMYSMTLDGESRLALMCGGAYNACCFTKDSMVLIPTSITTDNVNELKIYNATSLAARAQLGDWMGMSCYYKGARFVPDSTQPVYTSGDKSVSTVSDLNILVPEAFMRGDDLIVRTKYTNAIVTDEDKDTDVYVCLRMYVIKVYQGTELVAYDINKMQTMELRPNDIHTFTFVVGGDDILGDIDLTRDDITIEIIPTYDIRTEYDHPEDQPTA